MFSTAPFLLYTEWVHKPSRYQLPLSEALEEMEKASQRFRNRVRNVVTGMGYTSVVLVFASVVTVILVLRFYGLPTGIQDYLLKKLEANRIYASVGKLVLDPTGGIVAERVSVFSSAAHDDLLLQVDRVRIGIAWFSWWQGQRYLSASVSNAEIKYPLTPKTTIEIHQVEGSFDVLPGPQIQVRRVLARFLNLQLDLKGQITLAALPKSSPRTPEQNEQIDRLWNHVLSTTDDLDTGDPIRVQVDFNVLAAHPEQSTIHALIAAQMFRWRGIPVEEVSMEASLEQGVAHLSELRLKLARGELLVSGEASLLDKTARMDLTSDLDFTPLMAGLGDRGQQVSSLLNFRDLPICNAQATLDWQKPKLAVNVQADLDWANFTYGETSFNHLSLPLAYDGNRLFISDAEVVTSKGSVKAEVLDDFSQAEIKGRLQSNLDPTVLKGILGPKADLFLGSLQFFNGGPDIKLKLSGQSSDPKQWVVAATVNAQNFSYKNVAMESVQADATYQNMAIDVPNLIVKRKEGQLTGGIHEDFQDRWVRITNLQANVLVQEADVVLGPRFVSYVDKYHLDRPPTLVVNGLVDLNDKKDDLDTDLKVQVSGQTNLSYALLHRNFVIVNPVGEITVKNRDLNVSIQDGRMYGGAMNANIFVKLVRTPAEKSDFNLKLNLKKADFNQMMTELFKNEKTAGTFDLNTTMAGKVGDQKEELLTIAGGGEMQVTDGYLMNIPVLSGLTFIVDNIIPGFGLSKIDEAKATFTLGNGVLTTKDLEMNSAIFTINGNGGYSYVQNQLDMDMRVNVRGVIGWLTSLVSKIFQYHGKGPLNDVKWGPKILGN